MPILKNARHEKFAQGLAEGKSQEKAYVDAGYSEKGSRANATKLLQRDNSILQRRDELLEERDKSRQAAESEVFRASAYDKEWIIQQAAELVARGMQHRPVLDQKGKQIYIETPNGEIAPAYTFNDRAVANGLRIIGLARGAFVMKHQQDRSPLSGLSPQLLRDIRDWIEEQNPGLRRIPSPQDEPALKSVVIDNNESDPGVGKDA